MSSDRIGEPPNTYEEARPDEAGTPGSQAVSWWATHVFLEAALAHANDGLLPMAGTPAWGAMADSDPRKLLALAVAGEHHVLRVETAQAARAEAGEEISAAAPWSQIAHQQLQRAQWEDEHPWARPQRREKGTAA